MPVTNEKSIEMLPLETMLDRIHNPEVGSSSLPRATKAILRTGGGLFRSALAKVPKVGMLLLAGCAARTPTDPGGIQVAMAAQEQAWDRGDIPGFMEAYSDTICFLSPRGKRCGKAEVQASYARNYPDKAAMGDLQFTIHEVVPAGDAHAWCTGDWKLFRATDTLGGGFSLLWTLEENGWRITRDHTY